MKSLKEAIDERQLLLNTWCHLTTLPEVSRAFTEFVLGNRFDAERVRFFEIVAEPERVAIVDDALRYAKSFDNFVRLFSGRLNAVWHFHRHATIDDENVFRFYSAVALIYLRELIPDQDRLATAVDVGEHVYVALENDRPCALAPRFRPIFDQQAGGLWHRL